MTIEQLNALKILLNRLQKDELEICVRDPNGFVRYNSLLYDIMKKYKVNIIEDLKAEIKKGETEINSLLYDIIEDLKAEIKKGKQS